MFGNPRICGTFYGIQKSPKLKELIQKGGELMAEVLTIETDRKTTTPLDQIQPFDPQDYITRYFSFQSIKN